ncbi:MAG: transporter permease [Eubacterium sp.]|jgi:putative aldouronate transport system permease protein|nr:transporter permease [Eubacterium sp.]
MSINRKKPLDYLFDSINIVFMALIALASIYPFWYVLIVSFNQGNDTVKGGIYTLPRVLTLENYQAVFMSHDILNGFLITAARTIIGTIVSVTFTAMVAYGLAKRDLVFRKFYIALGTITMFFGGGLIPTYILIAKWLHLHNNFLVYIIPAMFTFWNVVIFQGFFREIPESLEESAKIDGANEVYIFFKIIVPVAKPALATMALFNGVNHWNSWFDSYLYTSTDKLQTLQLYLYKTITQFSEAGLDMFRASLGARAEASITALSVQCATIIVAITPIILIYPFLQKYFTKGLVMGAVKG